ncbi:MAG: hypothetical protein U0528_05820 [Anaerolineae bacterium]
MYEQEERYVGDNTNLITLQALLVSIIILVPMAVSTLKVIVSVFQ